MLDQFEICVKGLSQNQNTFVVFFLSENSPIDLEKYLDFMGGNYSHDDPPG